MYRTEHQANEALAANVNRAPAAWAIPSKRANRKPAKRGFFARLLGL
jgi:hypothetical protein